MKPFLRYLTVNKGKSQPQSTIDLPVGVKVWSGCLRIPSSVKFHRWDTGCCTMWECCHLASVSPSSDWLIRGSRCVYFVQQPHRLQCQNVPRLVLPFCTSDHPLCLADWFGLPLPALLSSLNSSYRRASLFTMWLISMTPVRRLDVAISSLGIEHCLMGDSHRESMDKQLPYVYVKHK